MATSFFEKAHNFTVGEMNIRNVGGDYVDRSTKNVRNTYRGPKNYYETHDHSYHDNSSHHHGHNYNTTNNNSGPVNNIDRVDNANFGTNYGHISQNAYNGPQRNETTNHHHQPTTNNYTSTAYGGSVVHGNVSGTMNHGPYYPPQDPTMNHGPYYPQQDPGPLPRGPQPYGAQRNQGPSPSRGAPMGRPPGRSPSPNPNYGPQPNQPPQRPPPGHFTASDSDMPHYEESDKPAPPMAAPSMAAPSMAAPSMTAPSMINPWAKQQPPPEQQQHLAPPAAPWRPNSAPGRPQPNEEWKEHQSHPEAAPPAAYPPLSNQHRAPSPAQNLSHPSGSSGSGEQETLDAPPQRKERNSWSGKTQMKDAFREKGISDSSDSDSFDSAHGRNSGNRDGYGVGSGRQAAQMSKEEEARKEREAAKQREARDGSAPAAGWRSSALLSEEDLAHSYLNVPSRERLPQSHGQPFLTPTPVPESAKKNPLLTPTPVPASLYKSGAVPSSQKLQQQPSPSARPRDTPNHLESRNPLATPLPEASTAAKAHKPNLSVGGAGVDMTANDHRIEPRSRPSVETVPENEHGGEQENLDFHGVFVEAPDKKKKKKKGFLKKVFGKKPTS